MPVVPGADATLTLAVDDNGRRPDAGHLVTTLQNSLIDLVAQQAVLKSRFQREFVNGELDKAEKTTAALKALATAESFAASMEAERAKLKSTADPSDAAAAAWLDKQFAEIKPLATKYLMTAEAVATLEKVLASTKGK